MDKHFQGVRMIQGIPDETVRTIAKCFKPETTEEHEKKYGHLGTCREHEVDVKDESGWEPVK